MAREPEQLSAIRLWEELYRDLLSISTEQWRILEQTSGQAEFGDRMSPLEARWKQKQAEIVQLETAMKQHLSEDAYRRTFDTRIRPLIERIQETIQKTTARMKSVMSDAGGAIRNVQEHKIARQAYGDTDHDASHSLFFDEKK